MCATRTFGTPAGYIERKRAIVREAKSPILQSLRENVEPSAEQRQRLDELRRNDARVDDELERAFYRDQPG